jgi:hypothetical protein
MATYQIEPDASGIELGAQITCRLVGVTPLLMHRPGSMTANTGTVAKTNAKRIPTPEEECEMAVYRDEDLGHLYAPDRWITRSLTESGKAFQNPQNKKSTLMRVFAAAILPPPVIGFPLVDPDTGEFIEEYTIDIQRVVVMRAAVMRARPRIDSWSIDLALGVDLGALNVNGSLRDTGKLYLDALTHAGSKQGFGDFRPEKGGSYGRFKVENFAISDE